MSGADVIGGRCEPNGHVSFPPRLWCPVCGSDRWSPVGLTAGTVEGDVAMGRDGDVVLVDVRCDLGPRVTARAVDDVRLASGDRVALRRGDDGELRAQPVPGDPSARDSQGDR